MAKAREKIDHNWGTHEQWDLHARNHTETPTITDHFSEQRLDGALYVQIDALRGNSVIFYRHSKKQGQRRTLSGVPVPTDETIEQLHSKGIPVIDLSVETLRFVDFGQIPKECQPREWSPDLGGTLAKYLAEVERCGAKVLR